MTKLAVDLDGCVYNWQHFAYEWYCDYTKTEPDYVEFWKTTVHTFNECMINNLLENSLLYHRETARKDIVNLLNKLSKNYEVIYLTSRPETKEIVYQTSKWIKDNNFPNPDEIYYSKNKDQFVRLNHVDILIDDNQEVCEKCKNLCSVFLVHKPYHFNGVSKEITVLGDVIQLEAYL
jgi:5'(3')-deoxyribonucleotidase